MPALLHQLPQALLGESGRAALGAVTRFLPARFAMHQVVLECPLASREAWVDLRVMAWRAQEGPQLLRDAAWASTLMALPKTQQGSHCSASTAPPDTPMDAPWRAVQALAQIWEQSPWDCRLDDLVLAFPLIRQLREQRSGPVLPRVAVGPLIESHDDALWQAWGEQVLPCLFGHRPDRILLDLLDHGRHLVPANACVFQVGLARGAAAPGVRVAISQLDAEGVQQVLARMVPGWDREAFKATFCWLQRHVDHYTLRLNIPPRADPQITLECGLDSHRSATASAERWAWLMQALASRGLCQPEKQQALRQCELDLKGDSHSNHWPREALQMQQLMCRHSMLQRRLSYVKLEFHGTQLRAARAGLALNHAWGGAWHGQHCGHC